MFPEIAPPDYSELARVARLLHRSHTLFMDAMDRELAPHGLTAAQYTIWSILATGRAEFATEICKEISYDPGAMTRMLDRLEQKGLLRRIYSRENRRKLKLELTERGRAAYPEVQECAGTFMSDVMGVLPAEDLGRFKDLLERIVERLEAGAVPDSRQV